MDTCDWTRFVTRINVKASIEKLYWCWYLANLKSLMEGVIDLRNKNEKIQRVINS